MDDNLKEMQDCGMEADPFEQTRDFVAGRGEDHLIEVEEQRAVLAALRKANSLATSKRERPFNRSTA